MRCDSFFFFGEPWAAGSRRGGGWSGFDPGAFMGGFWGAPGGKGAWGGRRGRVFEQGDLKYVILKLLEERPRHGYEIIKELEDRCGGHYTPSPGTVYPTLSMLEDLGYARATPEAGGRKIYEITDEGRRHLAENRGTVEDIFERVAQFGANFFSDAMMDVNRAMKDLAGAVYGSAPKHGRDAEHMRKVREVLERAAREIEGLGK